MWTSTLWNVEVTQIDHFHIYDALTKANKARECKKDGAPGRLIMKVKVYIYKYKYIYCILTQVPLTSLHVLLVIALCLGMCTFL